MMGCKHRRERAKWRAAGRLAFIVRQLDYAANTQAVLSIALGSIPSPWLAEQYATAVRLQRNYVDELVSLYRANKWSVARVRSILATRMRNRTDAFDVEAALEGVLSERAGGDLYAG